MTSPTPRDLVACCQTRTTMGTPAISASALRGNLVDPRRAGMMTVADKRGSSGPRLMFPANPRRLPVRTCESQIHAQAVRGTTPKIRRNKNGPRNAVVVHPCALSTNPAPDSTENRIWGNFFDRGGRYADCNLLLQFETHRCTAIPIPEIRNHPPRVNSGTTPAFPPLRRPSAP